MFQPTLSDEEIVDCFHDSERFGLFVAVQRPYEDSIVTCIPNKGTDPANNSDHIIVFADSFADYPKGTDHRVCYLHFVKLLHEVAHTLTPSFARKTDAYIQSTSSDKEKLDNPEKMGAVWRQGKKRKIIVDAGSAWEMERIGGRVLTAGSRANPFGKELRMLIMDDVTEAPQVGNYLEMVLPDAFIAHQLELFDKWEPGQPLPDMHYPHLPTAKHARKSAEHRGGVVVEEEEDEEDEEEEGEGEAWDEEEYAQLQKDGLALTEEQERLRKQGYKF